MKFELNPKKNHRDPVAWLREINGEVELVMDLCQNGKMVNCVIRKCKVYYNGTVPANEICDTSHATPIYPGDTLMITF